MLKSGCFRQKTRVSTLASCEARDTERTGEDPLLSSGELFDGEEERLGIEESEEPVIRRFPIITRDSRG